MLLSYMLLPTTLQQAENDYVDICSEMTDRLGIDDIITAVQRNWLRQYGHVVRKNKNDWVKKCIDYEVKGVRPRGRPKILEMQL